MVELSSVLGVGGVLVRAQPSAFCSSSGLALYGPCPLTRKPLTLGTLIGTIPRLVG
jgi:hypothetical protein